MVKTVLDAITVNTPMTNKNPYQLELVPFAMGHLHQTFLWISDPELRSSFLMRGDVTWEKHWQYFEKVLADPSQRVYAILVNGRHAGNCGYKHLDERPGEGELWLYIGDASQRQHGLGKTATKQLLQTGFYTLNLTRVYLHVADFNISARRLYKGFGFVEVPMRENASEWENRGCTIIRMELIRG